MRAILIIIALLVVGYVAALGVERAMITREEARQHQVAVGQAWKERQAKEKAESEVQAAKNQAELTRVRERMTTAKPIIEAALADLAAKGVTREDVDLYFRDELYDEIEKQVCEDRNCQDQ